MYGFLPEKKWSPSYIKTYKSYIDSNTNLWKYSGNILTSSGRTTNSFSKHLKNYVAELLAFIYILYFSCRLLGIVIDCHFFRNRFKSESSDHQHCFPYLGIYVIHLFQDYLSLLCWKIPLILLPSNDRITAKPWQEG